MQLQKPKQKNELSFLASDALIANNPKLDSRSWRMVDLKTFFIRARVLNDRAADTTDTVAFGSASTFALSLLNFCLHITTFYFNRI